jgi:hypothetical protein
MDNATILKLYNEYISSMAYSACLNGQIFFLTLKRAVSITVWLSDNIILYEACANQLSVFQEIMQFIPKVC